MPPRRPAPARPAARPYAPRPARATRERLLEAAGRLFAERGYRGATLREIAEAAGANLAAANYYFGSKERLYLEVAREHFERLERRLAERGADAREEELADLSRAELAARLRARVRTMLGSLLEEDPIHAALMQRELLDPSEALPLIVRRWIDPLRRAMDRIVAHLVPGMPAEQVERCTRSIVGQVAFYLTHRPALLLLMGRRAWPRGFADEAADHITEFALGGIERLASRGAATDARRAGAEAGS
jgi:AcrR family transcriptional regulator